MPDDLDALVERVTEWHQPSLTCRQTQGRLCHICNLLAAVATLRRERDEAVCLEQETRLSTLSLSDLRREQVKQAERERDYEIQRLSAANSLLHGVVAFQRKRAEQAETRLVELIDVAREATDWLESRPDYTEGD